MKWKSRKIQLDFDGAVIRAENFGMDDDVFDPLFTVLKECCESCNLKKKMEPSLKSSQVASPHFWSEHLPCSSKMCSSPPPPDTAFGRRRRSRVREASRARRFPPACIRHSCCNLTCHSSSRFLQERVLVSDGVVDPVAGWRFRQNFSGLPADRRSETNISWLRRPNPDPTPISESPRFSENPRISEPPDFPKIPGFPI